MASPGIIVHIWNDLYTNYVRDLFLLFSHKYYRTIKFLCLPCLSMKIPEQSVETGWLEKEAGSPISLRFQPGLCHQLSSWAEEPALCCQLLLLLASHASYFIWLIVHMGICGTQHLPDTAFHPKDVKTNKIDKSYGLIKCTILQGNCSK